MTESNDPADFTEINVDLAIEGMPTLTNGMIQGGLYVMIAATPSARFPVLASSIAHALRGGVAVNVVVPAHPALFLQRVNAFGNIDTAPALAEQRLGIFEMQEEFPKKMFRLGPESFVREMEQLGIPDNSYLVFDQADELLALHDIGLALDQIDILGRWLAQRRITALLVMTRASGARTGTITALMDSLTGIVHLGGDRDGLALSYDYWQSREGTIAARSYRLSTLPTGLYQASVNTLPGAPAATDAPFAAAPMAPDSEVDTDERYFYMDPALATVAGSVPGIWQQVDSLVGMLHATQNTVAPTCLLSFERQGGIRQLAQAVHTLRLSLGRAARIVVQEKDVSLRYQNEALLLRLGVNMVVHRDVPNERMPLLLESLNGQLFSRNVNIDFETALASVLPTRLRGYLAPQRFAREAAMVLDRAQPLHIPCALVSGVPLAGFDMGELMGACRLSRPGDLITTDGTRCFIFFNACPQSALLKTLERVLGRPTSEVFGTLDFMAGPEDMVPALTLLAARAAEAVLPDYSHLSSIDATVQEEPDAPMLVQFSAPVPVHAAVHTAPRSALPALERAIAQVVALTAPPGQVGINDEKPNNASNHYRYDGGSSTAGFGKQAAPRATRSAKESQQA